MSLNPSWRQFQLFDFTPITDPNVEEPLYSGNPVSSICATEDYLVVANNNSMLKIADKSFNILCTFEAYNVEFTIEFIQQLKGTNIVATVAKRQGVPGILRLWDLNKTLRLASENGKHDELRLHYITQVDIHNGDNMYPISCVSFNKDFSCLVIGYANGKVILIRGDILRDRGSRQRLIFEASDPITGLHFNDDESLIYVVTTVMILTVSTSGRNQRRAERILSRSIEVGLHCSTIDSTSHELIVGVNDSIKFYSTTSKVGTISFEMPKKQIFRFGKKYLLIVSTEENTSNLVKSVGVNSASMKLTRIIVLDIQNRYICFNVAIRDAEVLHIFKLWGNVSLLDSRGTLYQLNEKAINQQIELVLQRKLFSIAYNLAVQSDLSFNMLYRIQNMEADHLYAIEDFEKSVDAYIKCLNLFASSYESSKDDSLLEDFTIKVITKFKDVSNINNLTKFLSELFKLHMADNDSVTLLLCCYCKLRMTNRIDDFIENIQLDGQSTNKFRKLDLQDLNFKLILNLFEECGYFPQAIKLLYKLNQPNLVSDIQLNRLNQHRQCFRYIKTLPIDDLLLVLIDHSKTLLDRMPLETTELLINVFTGKYSPSEDSFFDEENPDFLSTVVKGDDSENQTFTLSSYTSFLSYLSNNDSSKGDETKSSKSNEEPTYLPPRPRIIFPSFMNHPNEFVIFLEACLASLDRYKGRSEEKVELISELLELYLSLAGSEKKSDEEWLSKAEELVEKNISLLDQSKLLLISNAYNFKFGEAIALETLGYETSLFRSTQASGDIAECFRVLQKYGPKRPSLYKYMLEFLVSKESIYRKAKPEDFSFLLEQIKKYDIASPVEIIRILSLNEYATLGLVKDYLLEYLRNSNKEISNNAKLIDYYEKESSKNLNEFTKLNTDPYILKNTKCSECGSHLNYPIIHFKCSHSFHMRCISDGGFISPVAKSSTNVENIFCPLCVTKHEQIRASKFSQLDLKAQEREFQLALSESKDKFKVLTNYMMKGIMDEEYEIISND